jgi:hypothetical protein
MTISFRSQGFQDLYKGLDEKYQAGEIESYEDIDKFIKEADTDISTADFLDANDKFDIAMKAGETDFRAVQLSDEDISLMPDKLVESVIRTGGRLLGEAGRGIQEAGETFLPEDVTRTFGQVADTLGEYVPEPVKEAANELFDPYHGDDMLAAGEELAGTIGSFLVGGGALIKGATKGYKGAKTLAPGMRSVVTRTGRKLGRRPRSLVKAAGRGSAYAGAATIIAPEDNLANVIEEFVPEIENGQEFLNNNPKFKQAVERLALNPDDTGAEKYLKTFQTNLGLGAAFAPLYLAATFRKPIGEAATAVIGAPRKGLEAAGVSLPQMPWPAWLSSRLGTDDKVLQALVEKEGASKAALTRAEGLAKDLEEAVQREYKGKPPENLDEILDKAIRGEGFSMSSLKGSVRDITLQMRQNIDELSEEIMGDAKGELKGKIGKNLGVYLTRSYNFFDDPKYAKKIAKDWQQWKQTNGKHDPDGLFASALQAIKESGAEDPAGVLNKLIDKGARGDSGIADILDSLISKQRRTQSVKSGLKRDDKLPESIRALLGEVKNPYENYVKTMANLSGITAQQRFTKDIANHLTKKGLATTSSVDPKKNKLLAEAADEKLGMIFGGKAAAQLDNPLQGLYVTPAYKKAIDEGLEVAATDNRLLKTFVKAKGLSQVAKTVFSPVTHGRNVMGNTFMMLSNGMLPGTKLKEGLSGVMPKNTVKKLRGMSNEELADRNARYIELGIANSNVNLGVIRRNLDAFDKDPESWLAKAALTVPKKLNEKTMQLYQAEDDFFKIAHFEKTLDYIKKSKKYKDLPLKEQERIAAQRTRDLMPNYNLVPRGLKQLRNAPVGDFLSFPAEMTRVSKNLMKYTIDDITSGDATLAAEGAKRLAGMTAVTVGIDSLVDLSKNMAGLNDEQENAVNNLVAPWEYNQDRIYLSGLYEDKRGHKVIDYLNLGPIDPFAFIKTAAKGVHQYINAPEPNTAKQNVEMNNLALNTFRSTVSPFLAPSMITEAIIELQSGKRFTDEQDPKENIIRAIEPLTTLFTPGILTEFTKRREYEKSLEKNQGEYAEKAGLYNWPEGDVNLPAFFGFKQQTLDLTAGTNFAVRPILYEIEGAGSGLTEVLRDPNLTEEDSPEIVRRYVNAQKERLGGYQKLNSLLHDYKALYGDTYKEDLENAITLNQMGVLNRKLENHLANAMYTDRDTGKMIGYFEPFELRKTDMQTRLRSPIPWETLDNIYINLNGTTIEEDEE